MIEILANFLNSFTKRDQIINLYHLAQVCNSARPSANLLLISFGEDIVYISLHFSALMRFSNVDRSLL